MVLDVLSQQVLELKKGLYLVLWARERYLWNEEDEEQEEAKEKTWIQHFSQSYCLLPVTVTGSSVYLVSYIQQVQEEIIANGLKSEQYSLSVIVMCNLFEGTKYKSS